MIKADARKLQALLSKVLVEQKAAAERAAQVQGPKLEGETASKAADKPEAVNWKWDVLRPVH